MLQEILGQKHHLKLGQVMECTVWESVHGGSAKAMNVRSQSSTYPLKMACFDSKTGASSLGNAVRRGRQMMKNETHSSSPLNFPRSWCNAFRHFSKVDNTARVVQS